MTESHAHPATPFVLAWIDGELYGLDLDALTNAQMRDLFITGIAPLVDETELIGSDSKRAYLASIVGDAIDPVVVDVVEQIYNQYGNVVERRNGRPLLDLARRGRGFPRPRRCSTRTTRKRSGKRL